MRDRYKPDDGNELGDWLASAAETLSRHGRWLGPTGIGLALLATSLVGAYRVDPGEVGVTRRFGKLMDVTQPGLHFRLPIVDRVDVVDISEVRRAEIGFRTAPEGPKRDEHEARMITGDENIIEVQAIVQYRVDDPVKYLFSLRDPQQSLHAAAEVALRGIVGQTIITSGLDDLDDSTASHHGDDEASADAPRAPAAGAEDAAKSLATGEPGAEDAAPSPTAEPTGAPSAAPTGAPTAAPTAAPTSAPATTAAPDAQRPPAAPKTMADPKGKAPPPASAASSDDLALDSTDILTTGREHAQLATRVKLQELVDRYQSGLKIIEVKLLVVDPPDDVKDAFHDVVRAREEREKKINLALGYRQDRIPRARGEAKKVARAAEAYQSERVLKAKGEAARFLALLNEYEKARGVTRERLHLETVERIMSRVERKVLIDEAVAKGSIPLIPLAGGSLLGQHAAAPASPAAPQGGN